MAVSYMCNISTGMVGIRGGASQPSVGLRSGRRKGSDMADISTRGFAYLAF